MSIQSEITRISGAKGDIADAIEYKGVTVPLGAMIDDLAMLVLQIESAWPDGDNIGYGNGGAVVGSSIVGTATVS